MFLPGLSSLPRLWGPITYQDFSLDRSFGDHVLRFTNEPVPVMLTSKLHNQNSLFCILLHQVWTLFYYILRYSRWMVSLNYHYQTFAVTITVLSMNESTVNICHCCECRCVVKPVVGVELFGWQNLKERIFQVLTSAHRTSRLSSDWSRIGIN